MDQILAEHNDEKHGEGCTAQIHRIGHPGRCNIQQEVTDRTSSNGSGQSYHVCAEPVKTLGRSQADTTNGKSECPDQVEYLNKRRHSKHF